MNSRDVWQGGFPAGNTEEDTAGCILLGQDFGAISPTTRPERSRCGPPLLRAPPSWSALASRAPVAASAGITPSSKPVRPIAASVNPTTRRSTAIASRRGRSGGSSKTRTLTAAIAPADTTGSRPGDQSRHS